MKYYAGIGSRVTPKDPLRRMWLVADHLHKLGWILRSGHAIGADMAFESGAGDDKDIYTDKRLIPNLAYEIAEQHHPAWHKCKPYPRTLHARNSQIIMGPECLGPNVEFVVCWTENGEVKGGTGQGIRLARSLSIPVFNMGKPGTFTDLLFLMEHVL